MDSRASKILRLITSQNDSPGLISKAENQHNINIVNNLYDELQTEKYYDGPGYMEIDKELLTQESTCCNNATNEEIKENSQSEVIQLEGIVKETTNEEAVETYHLEGAKIESSLVPYDESDTTLSEDDNALTATLRASEVNKSSSSKRSSRSSSTSSSSTSSSYSSSSSSSSDSDSSQSPKVPPRPSTSTKDNRDLYEANDENVIEQTSPQLQNEERDTGTRHSRKQEHDYQISPLCSDESEADLSDGDPTFVSDEPARRRNYIFAASDTSSSNSVTSESTPQVRGRKRTRNPEKWKQNKAKRLRNKGKSYVSLSKTKKKIEARCLKPPCPDTCRQECTKKIDAETRYEIFSRFWELGDVVRQRAYITACMLDVEPKYKYTNAETPRRNNKSFHFVVGSIQIRVCKAFFKATLDITDRMILTTQTKVDENGFLLEDLRGKHQNHKTLAPQLKADIRAHIHSIPRIESHYLRASTTREYIDGSKNIKDLYKDFELDQKEKGQDPGTYSAYYKIFTTEFNVGFFQPKKDQCDLCNAYSNANADQKKEMEDKYQKHIEQKFASRIEKQNDRKKVNANIKVAIYDLEAVLQCPKGESSSFYYKSKLNCHNLTVTELTDDKSKVAYKNVHCYFWTESDAKRGANEIGSCVWKYLKTLSDEVEGAEEVEVIFYSDNCCGQNKNKYIATLYLFAIETLNIKSITHKFLIRGHTQNEADSVHSLIEKEIKKNLKSGPIYTPDQYIALIKNAKKTTPALNVHEMTYESFYDLKSLQAEWGYNFTKNTDGQTVNWNEIDSENDER